MIRQIAALLALCFVSTAALGHAGHDHASGFIAGFAHPFMGIDHLLAMFALGVWAAQWKGRSMAIAPTLFVASMSIGALYALNGGPLLFVEHGIALSVLLIGLLVALIPAHGALAQMALPLIAFGAALHGCAHASALPTEAGASAYVAGFALATSLLHAAGILVGLRLQTQTALRRTAGIAIAAIGSVLVLGL